MRLKEELTDKGHWDSFWQSRGEPSAPSGAGISPKQRAQQGFFRGLLPDKPGRILELGCGNSLWLPYFASLGWEAHGLDYSGQGCELAREMLAARGLSGEIVCGDMFEPPANLLGRFDLVASWGLAEHFADTAGFLRAAGRYVKPGGLLFTGVPNLAGAVGWLQKLLGPEILEKHVRMDAGMLSAAHERAGLDLASCRYVQVHDFAACNPDPGCARWRLAALSLLKRYAWAVMWSRIPYPVNRVTSSYIYAMARTKGV